MGWAKRGCLILFFLLSPAVALSSIDTRKYPLKVEVLAIHWELYPPSLSIFREAGPMGRGQRTYQYWIYGDGNIIDGGTEHAIDFNYPSDTVWTFGPSDRVLVFKAKWRKPQSKIEVLIPNLDHEGEYTPVEMSVTVHVGVYTGRGPGTSEISQEISQDEYMALQAHPETAAAPQLQEPCACFSKFSVASNPASADIEIDGDFVGMTPSVLQLRVGIHTIALRKAGFKLWQRNMKVVAGDVTLNGDLKPKAPK